MNVNKKIEELLIRRDSEIAFSKSDDKTNSYKKNYSIKKIKKNIFYVTPTSLHYECMKIGHHHSWGCQMLIVKVDRKFFYKWLYSDLQSYKIFDNDFYYLDGSDIKKPHC